MILSYSSNNDSKLISLYWLIMLLVDFWSLCLLIIGQQLHCIIYFQ